MKILITVIFICYTFLSPAQNILQYQNIKIGFPSKIDTLDDKGVKVFYTNTSDVSFSCIADTISIIKNVVDQSKFYRSLQIVIEGYFSAENWKYFKREQIDTTMANVEGRFIHGYNPSEPSPVKEFFDFFTIVDGKRYIIMCGALKELTPGIKTEINNFLRSLKFEGKNY
jgi:hypothetical protein